LLPTFEDHFVALFGAEFPRVFRYLDRLSGEPDLAADLAQDAFVRLYQRGAMPERPGVWLITVALNLFRNVKSTGARRRRLLTLARAESVLADPPPTPAQANDATEFSDRVRSAMSRLAPREQQMLLLRAEGYGYRDIASVLSLNEASIGTLLARAKRAFREAYEGSDAS
jgi:RNA polymerase sigma-70 factor (ECF subfamily)